MQQATPVIPSDLVPIYLNLEKVYGRDKALELVDQYGFGATKFLPAGMGNIENLSDNFITRSVNAASDVITKFLVPKKEEMGNLGQEITEGPGFLTQLTGFIIVGAILYLVVPFLKDMIDAWRKKKYGSESSAVKRIF
jgi:hypothetical protein